MPGSPSTKKSCRRISVSVCRVPARPRRMAAIEAKRVISGAIILVLPPQLDRGRVAGSLSGNRKLAEQCDDALGVTVECGCAAPPFIHGLQPPSLDLAPGVAKRQDVLN